MYQSNTSLDIKKSDKSDLDNLYYNVIFTNTSDTDLILSYNEMKTQPILRIPNDYYVSVVRFSINASNVPIFIFKPNFYQVTLNYNGFRVDQYVIYEHINHFPLGDPAYFYVYEYSHMINMINDAILLALVTLGGLTPLPLGLQAPYFEYNSVTQLFSLFAQDAFWHTGSDVTVLDPTVFYLSANDALFNLFTGSSVSAITTLGSNQFLFMIYLFSDNALFPSNAPCPVYVNQWDAAANLPALASGAGDWNTYFIVSVAGATNLDGINSWAVGDIAYFNGKVWHKYSSVSCIPPPYLRMTQDYLSLGNWADFQSIVITSNFLPIRQESIPLPGNVNNNSGVPISRATVTDFNVSLTSSGDFRGIVQYASQNNRYIDMLGFQEMKRIDLQVFWQDKENNLFPLSIPPHTTSNIKLLFVNKDIVKSYNPVNYHLSNHS